MNKPNDCELILRRMENTKILLWFLIVYFDANPNDDQLELAKYSKV